MDNRHFAGNRKAVNLFNGFAAFFRSHLAFLKISGMKKEKGKLLQHLLRKIRNKMLHAVRYMLRILIDKSYFPLGNGMF